MSLTKHRELILEIHTATEEERFFAGEEKRYILKSKGKGLFKHACN